MASSLCLVFTIILTIVFTNKTQDKTSIVADSTVEIYNKSEEVKTNVAENTVKEEPKAEEVIVKEEEKKDEPEVNIEPKDIKFTILGEIMMGGQITKNVNYLYNTSFKKIASSARESDVTYATLATNITNLDIIEDAKSKYLITKEFNSAITTLGLDAVNVATDRMIDFPKDIFNSTVKNLKESETYVAGLNDSILYIEKYNKKIAIVAANNVIVGTKNTYEDYGINVYNEAKMKADILKAKENADFVIVDVHWGREYIYGVTSEMQKIAYTAIDSGANLIMGSNALGIYPIITYKNVPIIYSTGYLMTDLDIEVAKQSFIYDLNITKENKLSSITMTPIYITGKKEALPYTEYNLEAAKEFNNQVNSWQTQNNLNSKIIEDKIVVTF